MQGQYLEPNPSQGCRSTLSSRFAAVDLPNRDDDGSAIDECRILAKHKFFIGFLPFWRWRDELFFASESHLKCLFFKF